MEARPNFPLLLGLVVLSVASVIFSWLGWHGHIEPPDAAYLAVKSVEGNEAYEQVAKDFPGNVTLEIGRFLGLFVEPIAFLVLFVTLSRQNLLRFWASFKHGHLVVVGESAFADKLSESHKAEVVHLRGLEDDVHQKGSLIRLPFGGFNAADLKAAGAGKAARIVFACDDDGQSIELATAAQNLFPQTPISLRINDIWLADQLHNADSAERFNAFSEFALSARFAAKTWPPFLLAHDRGQERIHLALIGQLDAIEAMVSEMVLTAKTGTFGPLVFSIICAHPESLRARLHSRYPELELEAELHFHQMQHLESQDLYLGDIDALEAPCPLTAIYCLSEKGAQSLAIALTFVQQSRNRPGVQAPVFVLRGAQGMRRPAAGQAIKPLQIVPFGNMEDIAKASGMLVKGADLAERAYHEAYLRLADVSGEAATAWDQLKEEYKLSNRRAVAHIPAKLFDAGIDIRPWMEKHDIWATLPILPPGARLCRDEQERERLAELEHNRWIADRRINGWRLGPKRDNALKIHPDMRPFYELSSQIQDYDRKLIDAVDRMLAPGETGRPGPAA